MKNILFVSFLVISFSGFGQKSTSFGPWITMKCFSGIQVRSRLTEYNSSAKKYHYYYEMKSTYNQKVYFNYKFDGGAGLDGRTSLNPGEISTGAGNWTFGISKNGLEIEIDKVRFGNQDYAPCKGRESSVYAECDKRSSTPNWPPNCGGSDQTNIQASNTDNSNAQGASGSGAANVQAKLDAIQVYIDKIPGDDSESQAIIRDATNIINNSSTSEQTKVNQLEPLLTRARNRANQLVTNKEKEDKAGSERDSNFKSYYEKGMANYSSKNYDGAINNLQTSLNYAVNDQQKTHVQDWIAKIREEKRLEAEAAARKVRIEEKQKQEAATNAAVAGGVAAFGGLMALLQDDYTDKPFAVRAQIGLGAENMTMSMVETATAKELVQSAVTANFLIGFNFSLFNNRAISLHLNPYFDLGVVTLQTGYTGTSVKYGGNAILQLGIKKDHAFKFFAEGGYFQKSGTLDYDKDVATGGTTATDYLTKGAFDYSVLRYGGGIMLHGEADKGEVRIKPGLFFEEFSFAKGRRVMSANLHVNIMSQIIVELIYSRNYVIPGGVVNPRNFAPENKDFWSVKLIRQGLLTKK